MLGSCGAPGQTTSGLFDASSVSLLKHRTYWRDHLLCCRACLRRWRSGHSIRSWRRLAGRGGAGEKSAACKAHHGGDDARLSLGAVFGMNAALFRAVK
jgi:hypothetical protein